MSDVAGDGNTGQTDDRRVEAKPQEPRDSLVVEPAESPSLTSARADGRKALITTVVAIALNPVSLIAGYFINHLLQAPKLGIQYVIPSYTWASRQLGADGLKVLDSAPRMAASLRNTISQRTPSGSPQSVCTLWLDGKDWSDDCEANVVDSINGMQEALVLDLAAISSNIQTLTTWQPPAPLVLEPVNTPDADIMRLMQSIQGGQFDPKRALAQFRFYLAEYQRNGVALQHLKDEFDRMLKAPRAVTSDLGFKVGILNSGDSDGVVFNTGKVTFGPTKLNLTSEDYKVIKAHSFEAVEFQMFYGEMDEPKRKISEVVQRQNADVPFHVAITVGKKTIDGDGRLPKDE